MAHIPDPLFAERIRAIFTRQNAMALIQATLPMIERGRTEFTYLFGAAWSNSTALCMVAPWA